MFKLDFVEDKESEKKNKEILDILVKHTGQNKPGFGWNTEILMYDGSIKKIQDIEMGNVVMGDNSKPRVVLNTFKDVGEMYEVKPVNGQSYRVSKSSSLSLKASNWEIVSWDKSRQRWRIRWLLKEKRKC